MSLSNSYVGCNMFYVHVHVADNKSPVGLTKNYMYMGLRNSYVGYNMSYVGDICYIGNAS